MDSITVFGEVLFDCFPAGEKVLGGAPFNVAWHLHAFGQSTRFVSRIGRDVEGRRILSAMKAWGLATESVQNDDQHPTGNVKISLKGGEPTYEIVNQVAYDFIDAAELVDRPCRVLYHGSLALRSRASLAALERLRTGKPDTVFMDVNLRSPWWKRSSVLDWVGRADWVKLNEDEFVRLHDAPLSRSAAQSFLKRHELGGLVVTLGDKGALAIVEEQPVIEVAPAASIAVVDTVGAGDAFSSVLLLGLNLGWPIREILERAQVFASALVTQRGATVNDPGFYRPFIEDWNLK
jgi:fructokinase